MQSVPQSQSPPEGSLARALLRVGHQFPWPQDGQIRPHDSPKTHKGQPALPVLGLTERMIMNRHRLPPLHASPAMRQLRVVTQYLSQSSENALNGKPLITLSWHGVPLL